MIPSPEHQSEMAILHLRLASENVRAVCLDWGLPQRLLACDVGSDQWAYVRASWQMRPHPGHRDRIWPIERMIDLRLMLVRPITDKSLSPRGLGGVLWTIRNNTIRAIGMGEFGFIKEKSKCV